MGDEFIDSKGRCGRTWSTERKVPLASVIKGESIAITAESTRNKRTIAVGLDGTWGRHSWAGSRGSDRVLEGRSFAIGRPGIKRYVIFANNVSLFRGASLTGCYEARSPVTCLCRLVPPSPQSTASQHLESFYPSKRKVQRRPLSLENFARNLDLTHTSLDMQPTTPLVMMFSNARTETETKLNKQTPGNA